MSQEISWGAAIQIVEKLKKSIDHFQLLHSSERHVRLSSLDELIQEENLNHGFFGILNSQSLRQALAEFNLSILQEQGFFAFLEEDLAGHQRTYRQRLIGALSDGQWLAITASVLRDAPERAFFSPLTTSSERISGKISVPEICHKIIFRPNDAIKLTGSFNFQMENLIKSWSKGSHDMQECKNEIDQLLLVMWNSKLKNPL